jgi:hypothetical protein
VEVLSEEANNALPECPEECPHVGWIFPPDEDGFFISEEGDEEFFISDEDLMRGDEEGSAAEESL